MMLGEFTYIILALCHGSNRQASVSIYINDILSGHGTAMCANGKVCLYKEHNRQSRRTKSNTARKKNKKKRIVEESC